MVTDEPQCQAVLDAEKRQRQKIIVTFNYRYIPKHQKIKEILMSGADRHGHLRRLQLVPRHDARRRLLPPLAPPEAARAARCWVHKATHHFDLINWWLDADPVEVAAHGGLGYYGKNNPFRHAQLPRLPAQGASASSTGTSRGTDDAHKALRRLRGRRRLQPRRVRLGTRTSTSTTRCRPS